jgi:hypothetical protein
MYLCVYTYMFLCVRVSDCAQVSFFEAGGEF